MTLISWCQASLHTPLGDILVERVSNVSAMRFLLSLTLLLVPGAALAQRAPVSQAAACERLASIALPNASITLAQLVNAGAFAVPVNTAGRGGGGSSALAG